MTAGTKFDGAEAVAPGSRRGNDGAGGLRRRWRTVRVCDRVVDELLWRLTVLVALEPPQAEIAEPATPANVTQTATRATRATRAEGGRPGIA